jgi:hypothetical protein
MLWCGIQHKCDGTGTLEVQRVRNLHEHLPIHTLHILVVDVFPHMVVGR